MRLMTMAAKTEAGPARGTSGKMTNSARGSLIWTGLLAGGLLVGACAERQDVLPGKREPIDAVLTTFSGNALEEPDSAENRSEPIALPAQVSNSAAPQFEGSPVFRTDHAALGASLTRIWSVDIGDGDSRKQRITADPVVGGGLVYTLDAGSRVTAVSTDGTPVWSRDVITREGDAGDATGGGLALDDGRLFVSSGLGVLVALDASSGAPLWEQDLEGTASGRPLVADGLVYVTAGDTTGWAVEADSGRIAWQIGASESVTNVLGAPAPVLADNLVVFSFGSGELQAVFRQGGLRRWDSSVLGERLGRALSKVDDVTGTPVVDGDVLYAGSQAGRTVAVRAGSGLRLWTATEGATSAVLPVGGSVFMVSDRNELLRLDAADGRRIWGVRLPNFVKDRPRKLAEIYTHHGPVLAGGRLIVASGDGLLRSFNPEDGSLIGTVELPGGATTRPIVAGQTLYVVGRKGELHAFR